MRKRHMYASDNVVEEFYRALADKNEGKVRRVHIPRSDVFYVREAIFQDTGTKYSLDRVERAMFLEKMLNARDVLDPERKRDWE
tara:strand:- start:159 stop:410 length:252 start_codon:yes stop_codon:yes gene_type:complete